MELNVAKCRACLVENETMLSLYEVYEHELTLAMILQTCISTEVNENDGLPAHLCDSCILVLTQFYNFAIVYEESDRHLRTLLKKCRSIKSTGVKETRNIENDKEMDEVETLELNSSDAKEELVIDNIELVEQEVIVNSNEEQDEFYDFKTIDAQEYEMLEPHELKKELLLDDEDEPSIVLEETEAVDSESPQGIVKTEKPREYYPAYEEITKYECTVCSEAHLFAWGFLQHMRVKHNMIDLDIDSYSSTVRVKVQPKLSNPREIISRITNFNEEENNSNSRVLQCKNCDKQFSSFVSLQQHSKLHIDLNKKYVCEICGARFIRKTYLDDHRESHSAEKKHLCKFCGKAFRRRSVLKSHKRVHTHPNHYVCELCGRAFTNISTLKTHKLLIHIKERNFKCVICNSSFPLKSTLNKHVLRHQKRENGQKDFNCTLCEMQYRDKSSLKRHMEVKHLGRAQIISCPDCPKKYTSKANLMKHRRRHHAITVIQEVEVSN